MSKGNTFENDWLKLVFNATPIARLADNAASSGYTTLYASLHSTDPGEAGAQNTNEVSYSSYARVSITRSSTGWTVTANSVSPAANVDFPAGTSTSGGAPVAMYFAVGTDVSGTGYLMYSGTVTPNITCGNGVTPRLTTASAITED